MLTYNRWSHGTRASHSGFMRGTLGAIRAWSYGPETHGPPLFSIATCQPSLMLSTLFKQSSRYPFPTWSLRGHRTAIATQAGFCDRLFTGENPHGPHRCGKLARITEYYRAVLGADVGYAGVLTHNPLDEAHEPREFRTHWGHKCGRSLDELAGPIPHGWRLPATPTTDTGRNCALFAVLMAWAGALVNREFEVLPMAMAANGGLDAPLSDGEVAGLSKSVERYRRSWIAKGRFYTEAERAAWGRSLGLQSAAARRKTNANRDDRLVEGYRAGWSQRHLAKLFKMSQNAVWKVLQRHRLGQ